MERAKALARLGDLIGRDLHEIARLHPDVTIRAANGNVNKGWAGHVLERFLGIPLNSSRAPNFGTWELKVVPVKRLKNGELSFKETMAITMIDPVNVRDTRFEESHLLIKMRKAVIVARIVGADLMDPQIVHSATATGLDHDPHLYEQVKADYDLVRDCIRDPGRGYDALESGMGEYVQPRTKGAGGKSSKTRAFYAKKKFLGRVIDLQR